MPARTAPRTRPPVLYSPGPAAKCGPFSVVGSYGDADYNPMVHASTFDVASQTLFVLVSPVEHQLAIAIVELAKGIMRSVDVETGADEVLDGFNYDPGTNTLFGVAQAKPQGLTMRRLAVGSGEWSSARFARSPSPFLVPGLPHVMLIKLRQALSSRTRITTQCDIL